MAQMQRYAGISVPTPPGRTDQRTLGPQLPPIYSTLPGQATHTDGERQLQLPPMQVSPTTADFPPKPAARRSIPVAQLLTTDSPSPPRRQSTLPAQQSMDMRIPSEGRFESTNRYRPYGALHQPLPAQQSFEQAQMPFRQPQPMPPMQPAFPVEHYPRLQHQPTLPPPPSSARSEQTLHRFSPTISAYSSPSFTPSEASPRSSIGGQSHSVAAPPPRPSAPPPLNFNLTIRQQPAAARACGFGERDRRVIDPPPILDLKIIDRVDGFPTSDPAGMLALNCSLLSADGRDDETELPAVHPDMRTTQRLMGTLVASPYQAKDEHGIAGTFFVFPDLSCRSPGKYRLRFKLLRVEPMNMASGGRSVASIVTDVFSVYTAKDFPGMRASSALLKALRKQGLNVGVKKGSEARKTKGKTKKQESESDDEDEDEDEEMSDDGSSEGVSPKTRARKRGKRRREV